MTYFQAYGGVKALVRSRPLWVALLLMIPSYFSWAHRGWWEAVTSVLPNILGFTLGGMTLLLGFGDAAFRKALIRSRTKDGISSYVSLAASFMHFLVVQTSALLVALIAASIAKGVPGPITNSAVRAVLCAGSFVGYLLFVYGLLLALSSAGWVFRLATTAVRNGLHDDDPLPTMVTPSPNRPEAAGEVPK